MTPKLIGIAKMRIMCYMTKISAKKKESCKRTDHESRYVQVGILKNNRDKFLDGKMPITTELISKRNAELYNEFAEKLVDSLNKTTFQKSHIKVSNYNDMAFVIIKIH